MTGVLSEIPDQVRDDGEERSVMQREYVLGGEKHSVMQWKCVLDGDERSTMRQGGCFERECYLKNTSSTEDRSADLRDRVTGAIVPLCGGSACYRYCCLTSHTYDEELAEDISEKIIALYHPALLSFKQKMITRNIDS
jgi:hypothetical protein